MGRNLAKAAGGHRVGYTGGTGRDRFQGLTDAAGISHKARRIAFTPRSFRDLEIDPAYVFDVVEDLSHAESDAFGKMPLLPFGIHIGSMFSASLSLFR